MKILPAIPGVRPAMVLQKKLTFYYVDHTIMDGDDIVASLTPHEAALLGLLVKAKGRALSMDIMKPELWTHEDDVKTPETQIRLYILRLRKIMEPYGYKIEALHNKLYRLWPVIQTDWSNPI